MKTSRLQILPWWMAIGSVFYFLGSLMPWLGFFHVIKSKYEFLGIRCEFPPHEPEILLLQLVQIFFGLTGLALLTGRRVAVRMALVCGYLGLGIRLTHHAVIYSSLDAILQFDTLLRVYFIIILNRIRPAWESAPAVAWTWRDLVYGYGPPEEEWAPAQAQTVRTPTRTIYE